MPEGIRAARGGQTHLPTSIAIVEIDAPADIIFRRLTAPRYLLQWVDGLVSYRPTGSKPQIRIGAREPERDVADEWHAAESEFVAFSPDRSFNVRIDTRGFGIVIDCHLFESQSRTILRQSVQVTYKRWYKFFAPLTGHRVRLNMDADLARLKQLVEEAISKNGVKSKAA